MPKRYIKPEELTVEVNGKTYNGHYRVEKGVITVSTLYSSKSTQLGNSPAELIARILLREMAETGELDP